MPRCAAVRVEPNGAARQNAEERAGGRGRWGKSASIREPKNRLHTPCIVISENKLIGWMAKSWGGIRHTECGIPHSKIYQHSVLVNSHFLEIGTGNRTQD